jgi:hypothetical protein
VALTGTWFIDPSSMVLTYQNSVPAIIYIDKWGRRPMLLAGTMFMGFWLFLVGGLQGRFGHWGEIGGSRTSMNLMR